MRTEHRVLGVVSQSDGPPTLPPKGGKFLYTVLYGSFRLHPQVVGTKTVPASAAAVGALGPGGASDSCRLCYSRVEA